MKINRHIQKLEYPEYTNRSFGGVKVNLAQHKGRNDEYSYMVSQDKALIQGIARLEHLREANVLITAGADAALHHIAETFLDSGKIAVIPVPSFGRFEFHTKVVGAKMVFVKHSRFPYSFDLKQIEKVATETKATVIFLANPNNPTGELINKTRIKRFIEGNDRSLVVVDEVLIEKKRDSVAHFVSVYKNLIVVQSLSKLLGIPGLRIGYILANQELLRLIGRVVSPFEVGSLSLYTAKSLLREREYLSEREKELKEARNLLKARIELPLTNTDASVGLLEGLQGISLFEYLRKRGILTVDGKNFRGLEKTNTVRVVITSKKDIEELVRAVKKYKSNKESYLL